MKHLTEQADRLSVFSGSQEGNIWAIESTTPTQPLRQNYTRMYIFDEVVAIGFNTLCYDSRSVAEERQVLNPPHE